MSYTKQQFKNGDILDASQLNAMDEQIAANEIAITKKQSQNRLGWWETNIKHSKIATLTRVNAASTYSFQGPTI